VKLPIPADWDGSTWCRWAVCWPDSDLWEAILRGFLTLPQRGWTWDETTGSILAVQATGQEIKALNLPLNGVFMACNDTQLTAAFSDIALALRYLADKQCCDNLQIDVNGGFQGTVISPEGVSVPIFGSEPPLAPEPGAFPAEFETEEQYNLSKCQVANGIADGLIAALRAFSNISIAQFTLGLVLTVLAFAGAIVFPPAGFPALMIALGILGGSTGLLYVMANKLEENRPELVCLLYTGDSTSSIIGAIADFFDILIASIPGVGALGLAIKTVLLVLINSDTVNQLFNSSAAYVYPSADCAGCVVIDWEFYLLASGGPAGTLVSGELSADTELFVAGAVQEIAGDPCNGNYVISIKAPEGGKIVDISLASGSLTASTCGIDWAWRRASDETLVESNNGTYNFAGAIGAEPIFDFFARSTAPFTLEFTIIPPGEE
jgi:hypothetical protein